ncbi:MAG: class IV adenylate cyclase [Candidatus Saccharibacteria bacterium]|nr:class IV adenylate cyclase [Candidatus Saccharibacteria bacterium]
MQNNTEYEIKILNVDVNELRGKLLANGFKEKPRVLFKRRVYELDDGAWLRLRTDGKKTTLTYKKSHGNAIDGMEEVETEVSDFEATHQILVKAGIVAKNYQENYRTEFRNDEVEVTIDEWPKIPPYAEIEGTSVKVVEKYLRQLDLQDYQTTSKPTSHVYELANIDIAAINQLTFED